MMSAIGDTQSAYMDHNQSGDGDQTMENSALYDSSFYEGAGDSFITSVPKVRPSTMYTSTYEDDAFTSLNDLHRAFLNAIGKMSSRFQIFNIMDEWMLYVERALCIDRHIDSDIPEHVYQRLKGLLKKEYETWDLVKTLYYDRLNITEETDCEPFDQPIYDKYHLDEMTYAQAILRGDKSLQEMQAILFWLELNYSRRQNPDLTEKLIAWEQTLETLKKDDMLGKTSNYVMVSQMDPDAATRQNKHLHPLDADEELRVLRGTFHYLRTGNVEKAVSYLHESGHVAMAAAILGSCLSKKENISPEIESDGSNENEFGIPSMRQAPTTSEYPPESGLQPKQQADFIVTGNPARDLWKNIAWSSCEQEFMPKWERAIFGTSCGHRQAMLDVANSWEDRLWAYLKSALDTRVEEKLRTLCVGAESVKLPTEYWLQGLSINEIVEKIQPSDPPQFTIDYMFQLLQQCTMTDDLNVFLHAIETNIDALYEDADHPAIFDHLTRFLTHILLAFAIVELPYAEQMTNMACEAYIGVLVKNNLFSSIPFYLQKLSNDLQIHVTVKHIRHEREYSQEDIEYFLQSAADNDLDLLAIAVAIVDKLRDEVENFDVETLQWIAGCYNLVNNPTAVMLEFLRYTVWISRKYLTLGDLERVKKLIGQVTQQCIDDVDEITPALVREFICYREYLEAEEALQIWKTAKSQKPTLDDYQQPSTIGTLADRAVWERKKREFEEVDSKWRKATDFHGKAAIDSFMKILKFPDGGWLRNCCNPNDENETIHVNAVRRIVMKKVTFVLLNLIKERNSGDMFRNFVYTLTENHRLILEEFSPAEIGSIYKVVEEFTRTASRDLLILPK